jgi:hypothetical protein
MKATIPFTLELELVPEQQVITIYSFVLVHLGITTLDLELKLKRGNIKSKGDISMMITRFNISLHKSGGLKLVLS